MDKVEVRWLGGRTEVWSGLDANEIWDITEGERDAKPFEASVHPAAPKQLSRGELTQFWDLQRRGMDALKRDSDYTKAERFFRQALLINPGHEDSHYYLANCLAARGDIDGAIAELDTLTRINPQSHRAFQRKGELLAADATSVGQLQNAERPLDAALRLNPEETGTLLLLGEVELMKGALGSAQRRFEHACQANPRAAAGWFLRGYIAWKRGDLSESARMLNAARNTRGNDWKPAGTVAEGDVKQRMHRESGFLTVFEQQWDGTPGPAAAFGPLDRYVRARIHRF